VGIVYHVKQLTTGSRNALKNNPNFAVVARAGAEVVETTVKRLLRCWFRRTGKAMGQVKCISAGGGYVEK
jgi:hypothetical protein